MTNDSPEFTDHSESSDSFRHDLRTHLSAIVSLTELIRKTPDPTDCTPLLDALHLAADTAMAIVDGGSHLHRPATDQKLKLIDLLRDFDRLASGLAQAVGSRFHLHISKELADRSIAAPDPVYLHRILMLLLDNALKYGDKSEITLTADLSETNIITLDFADNGPGFSGEDTDLLFEPYHRGEDKTGIEGTGLGLWSARNILAMMKGTITARENKPHGALFQISLPIQSSTKIEPLTGQQSKTAETTPQQKDRETGDKDIPVILVVDDNRTNHLIMGEMLKAMNCEGLHAQSGAEALTILQQTTPDLAFIDIRMADMDGWVLAGRLHAQEKWQSIPLIAISSDPSPEKIEPFQSWLQRPVMATTLYEKLQEFI